MAGRSQVVSVYATVSPSHLSNVESGAVYTVTGYNEQTASYWSNGFGGGVTLGAIPAGPIRLGFDMRGSTKPGSTGMQSALAGVKLGIRVPGLRLHPYVQGSIGYLASATTNVSTPAGQTTGTIGGIFSNKYAAYEVMGGIDYPLVGPLDIRVVEVGVGRGALSSYDPTFVTINTGLVLHF
jgi:hypothetical protein